MYRIALVSRRLKFTMSHYSYIACVNGDMCKLKSMNTATFNHLYIACENGNLTAAKHLYRIGDNIKINDTMVLSACRNGYIDILEWLLSIYIIDDSYANELIRHTNSIDIVEYICNKYDIDKKNATYVFNMACANGNIDIAKFLYNYVDNCDKAFIMACVNNQVHVAIWLASFNDHYILKYINGLITYYEVETDDDIFLL